jgi:YebC/PmpR family DNA-binding regulatory protein
MSGHSKWHSIKHKKAAKDQKRGKLFTKVIKELVVAARMGGGDELMNPRLRTAVALAKSVNMPADTVKKAILRGTGDMDGVNYEEVVYEGYGPGGIALLVECLTDNKNRTAAEMRYVMSRNNGNLGTPGSVAWKFQAKGVLTFSKERTTEDELMEKLLDAGVEDITDEGEMLQVTCDPAVFETVKEAAEKAGLENDGSELTKIPGDWIALQGEDAKKALRLVEALEDHDDVQHVYTNFDIPEELLEE